jgi:proline iminopeptidase
VKAWRGLAAIALATGGLSPAHVRAATCRVRHFSVDRETLAYEDCGHGPVAIIHPGGPGLNARYMLGFAKAVADQGYRAILFEPRGTGRSRGAGVDRGRLTVSGSVADLEALRAALGARRILLIGHSFGGAVVQAYASAHPDHIARLVLLDSVGPTLGNAPMPLDGWRKRVGPKQLARYDADRASGDKIAAMRIKFLASFYHRSRGMAFLRTLDLKNTADLSRLSQSYSKNYHVLASGPKNAFPVSIAAGDIDWIRGYEPALIETYPNAQVYQIPHAGHFPWIDAPQATKALLPDILKGRPERP